MKKNTLSTVSIALMTAVLILTSAPYARGAAMHIATHGAAASGMGWCVTARPQDSTTIYYNPAGMTMLEGTQISLGSTMFIYPIEYEAGPASADGKIGMFTPAHVFAQHTFARGISIGLGFYTPYGLGGEYDEDDEWAGRYIFNKVEQNVYFLNPVAAVDLKKIFGGGPAISIAAGFRVIYGTNYMRQKIDFGHISLTRGGSVVGPENLISDTLEFLSLWNGKDGEVTLSTDGMTYGFNAGLIWNIMDNLSVGLTYMSSFKISYEGGADFNADGLNPGAADMFFADDDVSIDFNYPDILAFGISYSPTDKLNLGFELWYGNWHEYKEIKIDFEKEINPDVVLPQNFTNSFLIGFGAEYWIFPEIPMRCGFDFDFSPVPAGTVSPTMADNDRPFIHLGTGYHPKDKWYYIDTYYGLGFWERTKNNDIPPDIEKGLGVGDLGVLMDSSENQANGRYKMMIHMLGFTVGARF